MNLQARITDITTGLQSDKADVLAKISDELLAVTASIDNHTAEMISLKIEVTKNLNQNTSSIEKSKSGMVAKVKQERCSIIQSIDAQSTHIRGLKKDVISKVEDELCAVIESVDNQSAGVKQLGRLSPMLSKNPRPNLPPIGTKFSPSFKISALKSSNKLMPSPTKRSPHVRPARAPSTNGLPTSIPRLRVSREFRSPASHELHQQRYRHC